MLESWLFSALAGEIALTDEIHVLPADRPTMLQYHGSGVSYVKTSWSNVVNLVCEYATEWKNYHFNGCSP